MKDSSKLIIQTSKRKLRSDTFGTSKRVKYNSSTNKRIIRKKTTMSDLPNEMLLEILSHLRHDDLLNATLVSRSWNDLLSNTKITMRRFNRLYVDDENLQKGIPTLTRNYGQIQFNEVTEWNSQLFNSLRAVGSSIKTVSCHGCVFFDDDLKMLLQCFGNLETLEIDHCHPGISPINNNCSFEDKLVLKNLKCLIIKGYSWPLRLVHTPVLLHFEAESLTLYDQEWLIAFLNQQEKLQCLHLFDIMDLFDSRFGVLEIKFLLKELVLYDLHNIDQVQFMRMLSRVKSSVETVDLGFHIKRNISEYIFKNFDALTSLSIECDCLPNSASFYNQLTPNHSLKFVSIFGTLRSSKPVLQFLKKHPGIKVLKLKALSNLHTTKFTFWSEFSMATPNVCCLTVSNLEAYNMVYMQSKSLKHLDVDFIGRTDNTVWLNFCKNNPNIEDFHIFRRNKHLGNDFEKILRENLPKLRDIYVESSK